jgi:aldehyde:ferredoxin oxidoreductase
MDGFAGKLLRIDLTTGSSSTEDLTPYCKDYLGGRALTHLLLFQSADVRAVAPFDPANPLVLGAGPLCGTSWPCSARLQATFISPLSYSGWGDSNVGGGIGPELKYAGLDAVVITGRAAQPSYIHIEDDRVELKPARDIWGTGANESVGRLLARHSGAQVLVIGPAGEKLVRFASVRTNRASSLGRCGGGAVMGSKNLKGLVIQGSRGVAVHDPKSFLELSLQCQKDLMDPHAGPLHSRSYQIMSHAGTPGFIRWFGRMGMTPIKNWTRCGIWPGDRDLTEITGGAARERQDACSACPVHCLGAYRPQDAAGSCSGGPGYDAVVSLGHNCLEPRGRVVVTLNSLCNDLGLDPVEAGNIFSNLMEWYEKGIIDESFTDGVPMQWGNGEGMLELLPKIALRKGCGEKLAEGAYRVGKGLGAEALNCVYHQKGMCSSGIETRSAVGAMLSMALSPRGAHPLSGLPTAEWMQSTAVARHITGFKEAADPLSYHPEAKARLVEFYENFFELPDALGICKYSFGHFGYWHDRPQDMERMWKYLTKALHYATGTRFTRDDLLAIGERAYQIERAVIVMRGITREDDLPNWKCLNQECGREDEVSSPPLPPVNREKYEKVLTAYYRLRGWNREGVPTGTRLKELGLQQVADVLQHRGPGTRAGRKKAAAGTRRSGGRTVTRRKKR